MARENRTHHERMWMGMNDGHSSDLSHAVQCAMYDDALTQERDNALYTQVFVLMCSMWKTVSVVMSSLGVGRVIGATSPRKHNQLLNSHFCTFSPILYLLSGCML